MIARSVTLGSELPEVRYTRVEVVDNELVLLDQVLRQRQDERATPMQDDDAFELFACEQALGERDLSLEEVADCAVGGGNDGGLDGRIGLSW